MRQGTVVTGSSGGRYRVQRKLGEGVASTVYRAVEEGSSRPVLLKVLRLGVGSIIVQHFWREEVVLGLLAEAQEMAGDEESYVPRVLDQQQEPPEPFLVLEWVTGTSLDHLLREKVLAEDEALFVAERVLYVLDLLHESLRRSYTNFRLSNIWVEHDDEGEITGVKMQNWSHVSDEWKEDGRKPAHFNSEQDLARFATFLYRMLTGKGADEQGETAYALQTRAGKGWEAISLATRQLLLKVLHPDPEQRFPTALEFHSAVQDVQALWEQDPVELAAQIESLLPNLPDELEELEVKQAEGLAAAVDMVKRLGHSSAAIEALEQKLKPQLDADQMPSDQVESSPDAVGLTTEERLTLLLEREFEQGLKELTDLLLRHPNNDRLVHVCLEQAHRVLGLRRVEQAISLLGVARLYAQVPLLEDELEWAWKEALVVARHEQKRREQEFEREEERIRREYEEEEERLKREHEEEEQRRRRRHEEEEDRKRRQHEEEEERKRREHRKQEERKRLQFEEEERKKSERHRQQIERQKEERLRQEREQLASELTEAIQQAAWYRVRPLIKRIPVGSVGQDAHWVQPIEAIKQRFEQAIAGQEVPVAQELRKVLGTIDSAGARARQQAYDSMIKQIIKARQDWAELFVRRIEEQLHHLSKNTETDETSGAALAAEIEGLLPFVTEKALRQRLRRAHENVTTYGHAQQAKKLLREAENGLRRLTQAELEQAKSNYASARSFLLKAEEPTQAVNNGLRAVAQLQSGVLPKVEQIEQLLEQVKGAAKDRDDERQVTRLSAAKEKLEEVDTGAKWIWQEYINDQPPTFAKLERLQKEIKLLEEVEERRTGVFRIKRRTWLGTLIIFLLAAAIIAGIFSSSLFLLNSSLRATQGEMRATATAQEASNEAQGTQVSQLEGTVTGMGSDMTAFEASVNATGTTIAKKVEKVVAEQETAEAIVSELVAEQTVVVSTAVAKQNAVEATAERQQARAEVTAVAAKTAVAEAVAEVTAIAADVAAEATALAVIEEQELLPVPMTLDEINRIRYDIPVLRGEMTGWAWSIDEFLPLEITPVEGGPHQDVYITLINEDNESLLAEGTFEFSGTDKEFFVFTPDPNSAALPPGQYSLALQGYMNGELVSHSLPTAFTVEPASVTAVLEQTRLRSEPIYHMTYLLDGEDGRPPSPVEKETELEVFAKVPPPPNISPDSYLLKVRPLEQSRKFYWIRYPGIPGRVNNLSGITREQVEALPVEP